MSLDISLHDNWCDVCGRGEEVASFNITHNLIDMAKEAGIYHALWHPELLAKNRASDVEPLLRTALADMAADPERFKRHNPPNGWGTYDGFVSSVTRIANACKEYPNATLKAYR